MKAQKEVSGVELNNLYVDEDTVFLSTWAGANIGGAIDEAFAVREKTGKDVVFVFNGKVYEVNRYTTMEGLNQIFMGR